MGLYWNIDKKWVHAEWIAAIRAVEEQTRVGVTTLTPFVPPMLNPIGNGGWDRNQLPAAGWPGGDGTGRQVFGEDFAVRGSYERAEGEVFYAVEFDTTIQKTEH